MNRLVKSSDLIGIMPRIVEPVDVGRTVGIFTAVECKAPGWRYSHTEREQAQLAFLLLVNQLGGDGRIAT